MEKKKLHLEMIQNIITRMANNSFLLKGWTITLIVGILALIDIRVEQLLFSFMYIPIIVFCFLDAYYLMQERRYRNLYDKVRVMNEAQIDFSMNISNLNCDYKLTFSSCLVSISILGFYLPLFILVSFIIIFNHL